MRSAPPPSSRSCIAGTAVLDQARGNLRDALAGIRNLAQLLHSWRVGSKTLASALPDMHSTSATMRGAVEQILTSVRTQIPTDPALRELSEFFAPRLEELESSLRYAMDRPLNAKSRLTLEHTLNRLSLELDTARGLLDLLAEATLDRSTPLDLGELVRQTASGPASTGSWHRETLIAVMCTPDFDLELDVSARVATALFGLGVELVTARSDRGVPCLRLLQAENGAVSLCITQELAPRGEELQLTARGLIEPTASCLRAVCRLIGAELEWSAAKVQFSVTWPGEAVSNGVQSGEAISAS